MKKPDPDAVPFTGLAKILLCLMQGPVGHPVSAILAAVRITQHDFLKIATCLKVLTIYRYLKKCVHQFPCS